MTKPVPILSSVVSELAGGIAYRSSKAGFRRSTSNPARMPASKDLRSKPAKAGAPSHDSPSPKKRSAGFSQLWTINKQSRPHARQ